MKPLKTQEEALAGKRIAEIFDACPDALDVKLENFPKYARRKTVTRFLSLYEIFRRVLEVKGSIVECGVNRGFGLMSWGLFSSVLEPANLTRRVYGFDSFDGFPAIHSKDKNDFQTPEVGGLKAGSDEELLRLIETFDTDRFLGHIDKIHLVKGDAAKTIPDFLKTHQHLVVSLLFLDFDLYEPTKAALTHFLPRMPKGAVIAFDELDNPIWPGETQALLDMVGIGKLKIQRVPWDPYIGFATID
jgi:hypothetical protein